MLRDTHLKININHLEHNIQSLLKHCKGTSIGAVLKANAYGHGARFIAKALYDIGINKFLVSNLIEALELRNESKDYDIMIMGHTPNQYLEEVIKHNIVPTIFTLDQGEILNRLSKKPVKVHLKIETGFNRLGMQINEDTINDIHQIHKLDNIIIEGAFTHLALKNKTEDLKQFNKFMTLMDQLADIGIFIPVKHVCDSIGTVLHPDFHLDMVRVGALLYGLESEEKGVLDIKPILSFHTKLSHIKKIKKGETISYGNRWVAKKDSIIGTLPFGYADGYPRNMNNKGAVIIKKIKYPIIGVICMDQCMVELNESITLEDDVHIINEYISVQDIARDANTNKNDIVSRFTPRVPRIYIKNNKIVHIENGLIK
jgi:alanine racemase